MLKWIEGIGGTVVLLVAAFCLGSMLYAIRNKVSGRYLNRYYSVSHKGSGIYELHFSPALGLYYAKPAKYFRLRKEAIATFVAGYPDSMLIAETSTLQEYYAKLGIPAIPVNMGLLQWMGSNAMSYLFILTNLASYRMRSDKEWQFMHLMRRVHQTIPCRYVIVGQIRYKQRSDRE
ncbi:hypothetical protein JI735_33720 (plasmid) [Paenibacillus sonchi]|uniref:Uncharacterized protein n=1 Tax=Paenibacillus sonchi TaxID=373687 RepID=A0A974PJH1_9BACL|nr:hypothetical protein [Paenibacillus sonchi]QQZ64611.1 hypothetical protein JI735_33720 [Paenibacillus sonchi]